MGHAESQFAGSEILSLMPDSPAGAGLHRGGRKIRAWPGTDPVVRVSRPVSHNPYNIAVNSDSDRRAADLLSVEVIAEQ